MLLPRMSQSQGKPSSLELSSLTGWLLGPSFRGPLNERNQTKPKLNHGLELIHQFSHLEIIVPDFFYWHRHLCQGPSSSPQLWSLQFPGASGLKGLKEGPPGPGKILRARRNVGGWGGGSSWDGQKRRLSRSNRTWQDDSDCRERSLTHPTQPSMFCGKTIASCPNDSVCFLSQAQDSTDTH